MTRVTATWVEPAADGVCRPDRMSFCGDGDARELESEWSDLAALELHPKPIDHTVFPLRGPEPCHHSVPQC